MPDPSMVAQAADGTLAPGSYPGLAYWPSGSANGGPELSVGPWQVNFINSPQDAVGYSQSPYAAAAAAVSRYNSQGFNAWSTYTSGAYLAYLGGGSGTNATDAGFGLHSIPIIGGGLSGVYQGVTGIGSVAGAVGSIFNGASWENFSKNLVGIILLVFGAKLIIADQKSGGTLDSGRATPVIVETAKSLVPGREKRSIERSENRNLDRAEIRKQVRANRKGPSGDSAPKSKGGLVQDAEHAGEAAAVA